jgi:uncharacterized membrane protein
VSTAPNTIDETIDVEAPVEVVYTRWIEFEQLPAFMDGVESVTRTGQRLHWVAIVAGEPREWDAEITDERPGERIAWRSTSGPANHGSVSFKALTDRLTRVALALEHDPSTEAPALQIIRREAQEDLARFKRLIEDRAPTRTP